MIRGIIFDMDGVLVNTEPLHCQSYIETLANYGITLTDAEYYEHWTRKGKGIKYFLSERNLNLNPAQLQEEKRKIYYSLLEKELQIIDGADRLVKTLSQTYPLALVTSSYRAGTELILQLTELEKYFQVVITANEVKTEKPAPEGFLLAAQELKINPSNMLVIEDSEKGIIAAYNAGMKSVAVPNEFTRDNDFSLADKVISNIKELTPTFINSF